MTILPITVYQPLIGPRNDYVCANITTSQGYCLPWTNEIRYLGYRIYIAKSWQFRCSIDHARKSFVRSANAVFGKIGRTASEEVTLELLRSKCIPVLAWNANYLPKSDFKSLDFAVTRFLMKLFRASNTEIIAECQHYFGFSLPSKLVEIKRNKFVNNYNNVPLF